MRKLRLSPSGPVSAISPALISSVTFPALTTGSTGNVAVTVTDAEVGDQAIVNLVQTDEDATAGLFLAQAVITTANQAVLNYGNVDGGNAATFTRDVAVALLKA